MGVHFHDPVLRLYSSMGPVGNHALHAVGVASAVARRAGAPVVLCGMGDGTAQEGEVLGGPLRGGPFSSPSAVPRWRTTATRSQRRTAGRTFFSLPTGDAGSFLGVPILRCDGARVAQCLVVFGRAVLRVRAHRGPCIVVMRAQRADSHSNADNQETYRNHDELGALATADPLSDLAEELLVRGVDLGALRQIGHAAETLVRAVAREAHASAEANPSSPSGFTTRPTIHAPPAAPKPAVGKTHTMLSAIRGALRHGLASNDRVTLHGQDIEDPKGDVFGLTRGLGSEFGGRVQNSPLSEATIVGTSYGRALAGMRPVAMLQFADFIPLAFNQLTQELPMHAWRAPGAAPAPVVVMAPCGAYREGLGPYHAQTFDSALAHVPGIVLAVPSCAEDAAGLLNAALASEEPTVLLYPKSLLNAPEAASLCEPSAEWVVPGKARTLAPGGDLTLATWGSTVPLCVDAVRQLADDGVGVHLLDLRTLAPWDRDGVCASCAATGRLLVVHEDNLTGGFGAEVVASVAEALDGRVRVRRLARADEPVSYNNALQASILPRTETVVRAALELVGLESEPAASAEKAHGDFSVFTIRAFRASPSDESFTLVRICVQVGERIQDGHILGEYETDKCVAELMSPVAGTIRALHASAGDRMSIGEPIIEIAPERPPSTVGFAAGPAPVSAHSGRDARPARLRVICSLPTIALGARRVENSEIAATDPGRTAADIVRGTGIESRRWVGGGEDAVALAARAARQLLQGVAERDRQRIGLVLVATSSVGKAAPSIACRVVGELARAGVPLSDPPAWDLLAACSGFLYGVRVAHDHLHAAPGDLVLLLTAETLSPLLDPADFGTHALFADGASAVLLSAPGLPFRCGALVNPPGSGDQARPDGRAFGAVPGSSSHIQMDGGRVFRAAARTMAAVARGAARMPGFYRATWGTWWRTRRTSGYSTRLRLRSA